MFKHMISFPAASSQDEIHDSLRAQEGRPYIRGRPVHCMIGRHGAPIASGFSEQVHLPASAMTYGTRSSAENNIYNVHAAQFLRQRFIDAHAHDEPTDRGELDTFHRRNSSTKHSAYEEVRLQSALPISSRCSAVVNIGLFCHLLAFQVMACKAVYEDSTGTRQPRRPSRVFKKHRPVIPVHFVLRERETALPSIQTDQATRST